MLMNTKILEINICLLPYIDYLKSEDLTNLINLNNLNILNIKLKIIYDINNTDIYILEFYKKLEFDVDESIKYDMIFRTSKQFFDAIFNFFKDNQIEFEFITDFAFRYYKNIEIFNKVDDHIENIINNKNFNKIIENSLSKDLNNRIDSIYKNYSQYDIKDIEDLFETMDDEDDDEDYIN